MHIHRVVIAALLALAAPACLAAAASGRHWALELDSLECEPPVLNLGARIRYLGPKGVVEAPVARLVDAKGRAFAPKSLVWKGGPKALAQWLASGGLANVQTEDVGAFQLRFDAQGAAGRVRLEFGDIRAFALTRGGGTPCASLLRPADVQAPRQARPGKVAESKASPRIYRSTYPCRRDGALHVAEASYPPYLPKQLLFFGRGYLPNAREIALPMGKAPAQSYSYVGVDRFDAVEAAAGRILLSDFPQYAGAAHFAFNWGSQAAQSGNEAYSFGVYEVRPCPG